MLEEVAYVTHTELERELLHQTHTQALLLQQYFQQAEKFHVTLSAQWERLDDRALLKDMADFESASLQPSKVCYLTGRSYLTGRMQIT